MIRNNGTHRGVCGEWSGVDLLLLENQDRTPLKFALTAAIMLHLILFWWNIWPQGEPLPVPQVRDRPFIVYPYKPPVKQPEKKPVNDQKTMKVPIPDTTPHEVEPVLEFVADLEPPPLADSGADYDGAIDMPASVPAEPEGPIRDYLATSAPVILKRVEPDTLVWPGSPGWKGWSSWKRSSRKTAPWAR